MRQDGTFALFFSPSLSTDLSDLMPSRYIVCEYYPAGNVISQFKDNVLEQEGVASRAQINLVAVCTALAIALVAIM